MGRKDGVGVTPWTSDRIWQCVCAGGLVFGFVLPWVTVGGLISIPGYRIPEVVTSLANVARELGGDADPRLALAYGLYLIPLGGLSPASASSEGQKSSGLRDGSESVSTLTSRRWLSLPGFLGWNRRSAS